MNIEKYINSGKIRAFHPILNSWIETIDFYLKYHEYGDCPWWYNERATLSSFAAAVWKTGGVALEEYCTDKGKPHHSWAGRCDLFIGTKSNRYFACEAKQVWCAIGRMGQKGFVEVKNGLNDACKDARKLTKEEGRRLGICFAVPHLPPRDNDIIEERLEIWLKSVRSLDYTSIAWTFPEKARREIETENGYFYPGVVILIKEIFRQV